MRRDAVERRNRLIAAAEILFQKEGYHVALEKVAAEAGLGRGTLYRNFSDRGALAIAVFEVQLERLTKFLQTESNIAESFFALINEIAMFGALNGSLLAALRNDPSAAVAYEKLKARSHAIFAVPLQAAKMAGYLRQDITIEDVLFIALMLAGPVRDLPESERGQALKMAQKWLIDGIRPR